ncbi:hypothetical protein FE257_008265 [Aspergillus nanangensis]|uniref:Glucose-methanol-choline oxidoreductase N-terminal domain-containing protein n=1 Tax=Aspergillus nanangensis TaxID=2582783 RepID=A0AAD4GTR1_ASPNN|nr:hypothetical protein FE257_008265 [Aspergillus nanangensis]
MSTVNSLPDGVSRYDYLIVGGGTAGCVLASRLAEYLPNKTILLIEGGPSDVGNESVLTLRRCVDLIGTDLDYDYPIHPQERGNSNIRMSRAKVLGGCSSHNDSVTIRPFEYDCRRFEKLGATGWGWETFDRMFKKLRTRFQTVDPRHQNQLMKDWIQSASKSLDIPIIDGLNDAIAEQGNPRCGTGFVPVSYTPDDGKRSSASVAYIHPILFGKEPRPNLIVLTETWVKKVNLFGDEVTGVDVQFQTGEERTLYANQETILSAGAIDTPRLLLLSGIGPADHLNSVSIPVKKHIPGVGENLMDHPETVLVWEMHGPPPKECVMEADAALWYRTQLVDPINNDYAADVQMHVYQLPFVLNTERLGYPVPKYAFSMMPNVARPRSRGRVFLYSNDPYQKPALDFRYFTDPEGYDERVLIAGVRAARKIAKQEPFCNWIKREIAPGPAAQSEEDLSEFARRAGGTVYHPSGTAKMGNLDADPMAVVDPKLRIRGLKRVRIVDASVFPTMVTVNPMVTVLCIAERAAEMLAAEEGWKENKLHL